MADGAMADGAMADGAMADGDAGANKSKAVRLFDCHTIRYCFPCRGLNYLTLFLRVTDLFVADLIIVVTKLNAGCRINLRQKLEIVYLYSTLTNPNQT